MKDSHLSRRTILGASAALLVPITAFAANEDTLDKIRTARVLRIGNGGSFPPFEFMADGKLTGFDRDLGDELAKRIGARAEWVVTDFAGLIPALTSGRVDIIVSALTRTTERAKRIAFSDAYFKTGIAAAFRPDVDVTEPKDLAGKIVGVQAGTAGEKFTRDGYADKVKELRTYPEFPLALKDLEIGRIQVVVNTLPVLRYNLSRSNKAHLKVSPAWDARDVGMNTRLQDTELMKELNKQIAAMKVDGFLGALDKKWFGSV